MANNEETIAEELNIDILQYIHFDESGHMRVYIRAEQLIDDAMEYLQNELKDHEIIKE
tara:strand:+ start:262 stop:435 length:174 start_codon:yes stop_codon:yes gene_type:complete